MAKENKMMTKPKKQFCLRNHDTFICGRTKSGNCKLCSQEYNRLSVTEIKSNRFCVNGHDTLLCGRDKYRYCKECAANYYNEHKEEVKDRVLQRSYGITLEDYNKMFQNQNGLCIGCYRHQSQLKKAFAVDHDHKTGKIRGLLCDDCNQFLGKIKDNPAVLRRLADYLER